MGICGTICSYETASLSTIAMGIKLRFKRKLVCCIECGFLSWRFYPPHEGAPGTIAECSPYWRDHIENERNLGPLPEPGTNEEHELCCLRRQWALAEHIRSRQLNYIDFDELLAPRNCLYYVKYQPGYGPEEHKELKREADTRNIIFKAALLGAIIGACAAIFAQIIYVLFT